MAPQFQAGDPKRFDEALKRFDEENSRDPNLEQVGGTAQPRELVYARRLSQWVERLCPDASEQLRLAARSQHLCRWKIPRGTYPMTRAGYLRWREDLKRFHAKRTGEILQEVGYEPEVIARVQALNLKSDFPKDPESRVLEDALCLVFLQYQLSDLASKTSDEKVITALQKSWTKMTPAARDIARTLHYTPEERRLLELALQPREAE